MKKIVLFIWVIFLVFFLNQSVYAWSIGKVKKDEKNEKNFIIEIFDYEISSETVVEAKITPELRPAILDFFSVKAPKELAGKNREVIKKPAPHLIYFIDGAMKAIREKYYRNRKLILT